MRSSQWAAGCVRQELEAGSLGEVILAGSLGLLETQEDPNGGLDIEKANIALTSGQPIHVMLSRASGISLQDGILLEAQDFYVNQAVLTGVSGRGTTTQDTFSLLGFTASVEEAERRCSS